MSVSTPPPLPASPDEPGAALGVCTTSEAARLLGVSATTVQGMVERGELQAWKTRGGHRRIARSSIDAVRAARRGDAPGGGEASPTVSLLVVDDDPAGRARVAAAVAGWPVPVRLRWADDAFDALVAIERHRPDVLVTGLRAVPMDGLEFVRRLRAVPEYRTLAVVVTTALDDDAIEARGGLPPGVVRYGEPVPLDRLRGFVEACALSKRLAAG